MNRDFILIKPVEANGLICATYHQVQALRKEPKCRAIVPTREFCRLAGVRPSTEFGIGYKSDGPRLLAVAVLSEFCFDDDAEDLADSFVTEFICKADPSGMQLSADLVQNWVFDELSQRSALVEDCDEPSLLSEILDALASFGNDSPTLLQVAGFLAFGVGLEWLVGLTVPIPLHEVLK